MNSYRLYYFNVTGLAEPIRYLLSFCGIPFDDVRLDYAKHWLPVYKGEMPMEQVPVLEIDGVKYHQHLSICRFIARKNFICGSTEEEACMMDAIVEDMNDIRIEVGRWFTEENPELKAVLKEKVRKGLAFYLSRFEAQVQENDGFFMGKELSWVDIYYAAIIETMSNLMNEDLNKNYPNLKMLTYRIRSHMMIAPYIRRRPVTDI